MKNGRGGEIRTRDLYVPNVALYQAKLRPDKNVYSLQNDGSKKLSACLEQKENAGRPWGHQQGQNQTFNGQGARFAARPGLAGC
jgi:hypothetical protein